METMRNYLLLTPGPLSTSETVREAMLQDWCTWDKDYNEGVVTALRRLLLDLAGAGSDTTTVLLQGSGTYCVEATIGSSVGPEGRLLILANGAYGKRMGEIARYQGLDYRLVNLPETQPVTAEAAERALAGYPEATHIAMVHCETTTGILNPLAEVAEVIRGRNLTFLVDAMSSFGGVPIDIEGLGIDFLISSANKCIQGVPGFGFVIARRSRMEACRGISRSLSLDLYDQWNAMEQGGGKWRFTSPTHVVRAFFQALKELRDEGGIEARNRRYEANHRVLVEGMRQAGVQALLPAHLQSPIITSFLYPGDKFDFQAFYDALKQRGFVIYPGKISEAPTFRIGNIGDVYPEDFERLTREVRSILQA